MIVGRQIELIRIDKGLSRQDLASRCPNWIDDELIRRVESGVKVKEYDEAIKAIASTLNVSISRLFDTQTSRKDILKLADKIHLLSETLVSKVEDF